jgi:hypothetical protein
MQSSHLNLNLLSSVPAPVKVLPFSSEVRRVAHPPQKQPSPSNYTPDTPQYPPLPSDFLVKSQSDPHMGRGSGRFAAWRRRSCLRFRFRRRCLGLHPGMVFGGMIGMIGFEFEVGSESGLVLRKRMKAGRLTFALWKKWVWWRSRRRLGGWCASTLWSLSSSSLTYSEGARCSSTFIAARSNIKAALVKVADAP